MLAMPCDSPFPSQPRLSKDAQQDPLPTTGLGREGHSARQKVNQKDRQFRMMASGRVSYLSFVHFVYAFLFFFTVVCNGEDLLQQRSHDRSLARPAALRPRAGPTSALRNFQVSSPVYSPSDSKCEQTLMTYSFGQSYGKPFVGEACHLHLHLIVHRTATSILFNLKFAANLSRLVSFSGSPLTQI